MSLQTVSTEYAGPVFGKMLLVVVDAHSKGPNVCVMTYFGQNYSSTTGTFARLGLSIKLVSENGLAVYNIIIDNIC